MKMNSNVNGIVTIAAIIMIPGSACGFTLKPHAGRNGIGNITNIQMAASPASLRHFFLRSNCMRLLRSNYIYSIAQLSQTYNTPFR